MPRQQIVFSANTMDFWRNSISGLASNINYSLATSLIASGNIILSGNGLVLNVVNGSFKGNGSRLFALNALAMFGVANNARLQNTSLNVMTTLGISGGANNIALGSSITLTVSVNNSITNSSTNIPTSANSVPWAMAKANVDAANATLVSVVVDETRGGTGESTYSAGQLLIGNSLTGKFDKTSLSAGPGISVTPANGSINVGLNLIQGDGILLTSSGNGGITISANGYQLGNLTQQGIITLYDGIDSTSTSMGVTANAVNAVSEKIRTTPGSANMIGRLLDKKVYTTANLNGFPGHGPTEYTWVKPNNCSWIRVTLVGGGGAGGNTGNLMLLQNAFIGFPGASGAVVTFARYASSFGSSVQVRVGSAGYANANSMFSSSGASSGGDSWFEVGENQTKAPGGAEGYQISCVIYYYTGLYEPAVIENGFSIGRSVGMWGPTGNAVTGSTGDMGQWQYAKGDRGSQGTMFYQMNQFNWGGAGGSTAFGTGGEGFASLIDGAAGSVSNQWGQGQDAVGYGAGGGGCWANMSATPRVSGGCYLEGICHGGNGAPGLVIVESYANT